MFISWVTLLTFDRWCDRGRRWTNNDAAVSHRDDAANIGRPLLLPHRHRLQLTPSSGPDPRPAVPPVSLLPLSEIKENGYPSFHLRQGAMRRRGTSQRGPREELMTSHPFHLSPIGPERRNSSFLFFNVLCISWPLTMPVSPPLFHMA